jgi:hypothetical protein
MAPQQPLVIIDPPAGERSTATPLALGQLVAGGQLAANKEGQPAEWIVPSERERVPNPPYGYVSSIMRFHERGYTAPAGRFMRALCYDYSVELQNFEPNAISQAATFVSVCEGFLGIPVNWDLWVHLFRAELHTLPTLEPRIRRAARAGGLALAVRSSRKEEYIPYTMTTNNADWERGWFYLCNAEPGLPPFTDKVLRERPPSWYHGVSPPQHQARLDSLVATLKKLADRGLTTGCVLANLHHRRIVSLMERPLRIFEMSEAVDPIALARLRLLPDPFPRAFAATRARRAIDPRPGRCDDMAPWAFEMLPTGPLVSGVLDFISSLAGFSSCRRILSLRLTLADGEPERREVRPAHARSRALARTAQQRERERVARRKECETRHRERRERRSEEFRLREQQGLSSPGTEEYSSSDEEEEEEEEEVREQVLPTGGSMRPRHRSRLRWQE